MRFIYRFEVMTTPCELQIFGKDKSKTDQIASLVLKEAKRLEKKYNYFDQNSYLSSINKREIEQIDTETKNIIKSCIYYHKKTDGIFDITIGTIKDIFLYSSSISEIEQRKNKLLDYIGCEHIKIKKDKIIFDNLYTKIDLGGYVKEYAVDRATAILKKKGFKNALINFGGDIFAIGKKPDGEKFKIGIKDPKNPKDTKMFVEICDEALTTSASYERYKELENKKISHIISKKDIQGKSPESVTVISGSCVRSGVFSTSLMIDPAIKIDDKVIIL